MPLVLDPGGSAFVVFRIAASSAAQAPAARTGGTRIPVDGPWAIQFPPDQGAPQHVAIDHLQSWAEHSDPGVRHFSGTATYLTEFEIAVDLLNRWARLVMDLGAVKNIATIIVNGTEFPTLWKPPFRCDISPALRAGKNRLQVRVTNLWPNRLIGDESFPDDSVWGDEQTFGYTTPPVKIGRPMIELPGWLAAGHARPPSGRQTFTTYKFFSEGDELMEAGLIGPVFLQYLA